MKLGLEHIGMRIRYEGNAGYLRLTGFRQEVGSKEHRLITDSHDGHAPTNGDGIGWFNDAMWQILPDGVEDFDFTRFGCNRQHVEDLVKVLDARYVHKEK